VRKRPPRRQPPCEQPPGQSSCFLCSEKVQGRILIITRSSKVHRAEIAHWVRIITEVKKPNRNSKTSRCPAEAALPCVPLHAAPYLRGTRGWRRTPGPAPGTARTPLAQHHGTAWLPGESCQGG